MFFQAQLVQRGAQLGLFGVAALLCARTTESAPTKASKACTSAYKNGLQLEETAHLRQARDTFGTCMKAACGAVRQKCASRYAQLDADIPSVIPIVTDASGAARSDVQVTIDGVVLTSELDGRPLPVDPGLHAFAFTTDGNVLATRKIMIVQGERNRAISIEMGSPDARGAKRNPSTDVTSAGPAAGEEIERAGALPERSKAPKEPVPAAAVRDDPPPKTESTGGSVAPYLLGGFGLASL